MIQSLKVDSNSETVKTSYIIFSPYYHILALFLNLSIAFLFVRNAIKYNASLPVKPINRKLGTDLRMNMNRPSLTIIIPSFNSSKTIIRTLRSIYDNLNHVFELVVVDDCSSDETVLQVENFIERNQITNLAVIQRDSNCGPGVTRDVGLAAATGDFVLFFDSDDVLLPAAVDEAISVLRDTHAPVAIMPYNIINSASLEETGMWSGDQSVFERTKGELKGPINSFTCPYILGLTNYPWNKIVRTDFLRKIQFSFGDLRLHEDIIAHWKILLNADNVVFIHRPICNYYFDSLGSSATNNKTSLRLQSIAALEGVYDYLHCSERYQHAIPMYTRFALELLSWAYSNIHSDYHAIFTHRARELLLKWDFNQLQLLFHDDRNLYAKAYSILVKNKVL